MGITRTNRSGKGNSGGGVPEVGALAIAYPALWEWLTATSYDDGSPRQTSTLLIFVEDGQCKACLSDRDEDCSGWASGATLEGVMESLDARLTAGTLDWRAKRKQQQGRRK